MKYNEKIAGFEKSKSINYSTQVTATKGEKIALWISVIIFFTLMFFSMFILKNIFITIIIMVVGIFSIISLMFFCVFRPLHKEERQRNAVITKSNINQSYNNITGKFEDNSKIEQINKG